MLYACALATLYARVPVARMPGVRPGISAKDPVVKPPMKAVTDDAGRPAAMTAGGTSAGIVVVRRLVRTEMYTALATELMAERMDPAAVVRC